MSDIEREAFERWYIDHMAKEGMKPETIDRMKEMREGDDYGKRGYLNGCWHGWQAARQAPASGEVEPVAWVDCPVCGEPDMQKTEHERGTTLIHCCNHNCASNGGTNSVALTHPPSKVPEGSAVQNCSHPDCGRFYDNNSRRWECRARYADACVVDHQTTTPAITPKAEWPAMPDKFYEGLGWMHAECCAALDRGEDPRNFEVGDMVKRCICDLTAPPQEQ